MPTVKGYAAATRPGTPLPGRITGLVLIVLVVTLIPYLCGYLLAPPRKAFRGALNNIGDLTSIWRRSARVPGVPGRTPTSLPRITPGR